ncbi:TonB-dependent receptor [Novosphingobium capsulatum]|uniref:TonB-dependent receptor n=1 Tax=Novosphingobium capsulatum TaxID=13688 RepID=UPI0007884CD4|nr:TonB-dependent receptor [Novosphingobium capsulatum]WQD93667.1 TonB-dependent receptor [Novosphingobium capsulatum]
MHRSHFTAGSMLALGMALASTPAFAQSTGSVDFEQQAIVVSGHAAKSVNGVQLPDTPKAKQVLDQTIIAHQTPGQTINDIINLVPGVSFQNNDPFGSAGGKLFIRGFDNTRISQTFDGMPLNDTGNYALYSNQQLDPEIIEQVNVNLGTTDVDSPTAAASGSTVNYRSRMPTEDFHARMLGSVGDFNFMRIYGEVDTGNLTASGLRGWITASSATNNAVFGGIGKIDKKQFNAKLYQPLGSNGDFISIAGHYNKNRNNFFGSVPMWTENYGSRVVGGSSANRYPLNGDERFYQEARCTTAAANAGVADVANSCGSDYEYRYNPSDTANVRINTRFTLADGLVLTVDPSIQWTSANGGGTVVATEAAAPNGTLGFNGSNYYFGRDLNGDGDLRDTVRLLAPSQTKTARLGLLASLRYDINPNNTIRVAYSYDRGRHKQTGELGNLYTNGFGVDYFPSENALTDAKGNIVQKRNRLSYAILHQVSAEYRGTFDALSVNIGLRMPFMKRNLNNKCFTTGASGGVACYATSGDLATNAAANPYVVTAAGLPTSGWAAPQQRVFTYSKPLPTVGFTLKVAPSASIFANYSKGLQVPGTDNLYNSFYFPLNNAAAKPDPETTDNFDAGVRFRSGPLLAQVSAWYTIYQNRLASAFDRDLQVSIYRNLGRVDKYGFDGSLAYAPTKDLSFYVFGSYLHSKIRDNVDAGTCSAANVTLGMYGCTAAGTQAFYQTAGKRESGAPVYTFGGRVDGTVGPLSLGVQAKRTGPRYVNDQNLPFYVNSGGKLEIFPAKTRPYTVVDLDAKLALSKVAEMFNERTFLQLNVTNVFDVNYVGGFDGTLLSQATNGNPITYAQLSPPRTLIATLSFGF